MALYDAQVAGRTVMESTMEHLDVLVVGAGISGIGAGYHLQTLCPGRTYAIFEARAALGGTWDLFRYPGIRSDSDMFTLGFAFKPWTRAKAIADGPSILEYLHETVVEFGIDRHIRYGATVKAASWDSATSRWTVDYEADGQARRMSCNFIFMGAGYFDYQRGHRPHFEGEETFAGSIIEPQFWPAGLDYAGKRVVVIGSGATAVTLVPAMAPTAAKVTMLQRSPTYVVSRPGEDAVANSLRKFLPAKLAYALVRWRNVLAQVWFYNTARRKPGRTRKALLDMARTALGDSCDVDTHFTPRYDPWTQRLCLVPDADLFEAIKAGTADVVTDHIDRFTSEGIVLKSGRTLKADIVVAATGLEIQVLGGVAFSVDGAVVDFSKTFIYRGMMYSGVPNLCSVFGYINASWTLKADLIARHACRILERMERGGFTEARPVNDDPNLPGSVWFADFGSGYLQRGMRRFPRMGPTDPWVAHQNYLKDRRVLSSRTLDDGVLRFSRAAARTAPAQHGLEAA